MTQEKLLPLPEHWKQNMLNEYLNEYASKDIFNGDQACLFSKCLLNKTLTFKNQIQ